MIDERFCQWRRLQEAPDTARDNLASQRVLEKVGLHRTRFDENLHYYETEATTQASA